MNKQEYLTALEKALRVAGVRDYADIVDEYEEHFEMKTSDGFSEEEIAAKLASPTEIAGQFGEIEKSGDSRLSGIFGKVFTRIFKIVGVVSVDVAVVGPVFLMLYGWIVTFYGMLFTFSLTGVFMAAGLGQLTQNHPYINTPPMPYVCSLFVGISLIALAGLSFVGVDYCRMYVNQMFRKFIRWHKNVIGKKGAVSPPLPLRLVIGAKKRRVLRTMALVSLVVFVVGLVVGLALMMILSGSFEPWHVWGWFM